METYRDETEAVSFLTEIKSWLLHCWEHYRQKEKKNREELELKKFCEAHLGNALSKDLIWEHTAYLLNECRSVF